MKGMASLFVTCARGLAPLLAQEVKTLGFRVDKVTSHGVTIEASLDAIYTINYGSRLATRVLLPLLQFRCRDREELLSQAGRLDWVAYIPEGKTFAIDAQVRHPAGQHPAFRHTLFAAQVLKDAICDQYRLRTGDRPSVQTRDPDVQLHLRIDGDFAQISLDTSGSPLFHRGYRTQGGAAPLQESLAAAVLLLAGYDGTQDLLDPFCGSGTILTEAAMLASRIPPGRFRARWGFELMPDHDAERFAAVRQSLDAEQRPMTSRLMGCDISPEAIALTREHLTRIGASAQLSCSDCVRYQPILPPSLVVTNPPYGERLALVPLAHLLTYQCPVFLLSMKEQPLPVPAKKSFSLSNGGLSTWLHGYLPQSLVAV
jgi:putative N6-adenine-specific DNA methylase